MKQTSSLNSGSLQAHWLVVVLLAVLLLAYIVTCHVWGTQLQLNYEESQRLLLRSLFYGVGVFLFPLTNLVRFVLLRLDQTMPGDKPAAKRYFSTVVSSLLLIEILPVFGMTMFILGDGFNTFYIFMVFGALGLFLHRPKIEELAAIERALSAKNA